MAKVKITGHASGTGILTVTAPNTSTDRTITLPDATDTLIGAATTDALTTRINATGGRKNMIINGAMNVVQRGTSSTGLGATDGYYVADRFNIDFTNTAGRLTMTQDSDAPDGFGNSLKLDCTTADTSIATDELCGLQYRFEGQDLQHLKKGTADAESITVSFYAKQNESRIISVALYDGDNSRMICQNVTVGTSWARHTITFAGDTTGAFGDDNARSLDLWFYLHAGATYQGGALSTSWASYSAGNRHAGIGSLFASTSNTFFLTGVQMELGSVATDYEHRSYGEELALCQRYYWKLAQDGVMQVGRTISSNRVDAAFHFPVTMRASPTLNTSTITFGSMYHNGTAFVPSSPTPSGVHLSVHSMVVRFGCSETITANHASSMQISIVELDSEL